MKCNKGYIEQGMQLYNLWQNKKIKSFFKWHNKIYSNIKLCRPIYSDHVHCIKEVSTTFGALHFFVIFVLLLDFFYTQPRSD
jgi:hypothetical protein